MCDLSEIEAALQDTSSGLKDRIVRDIGDFTVALLGVFETTDGECTLLGGTGTLVALAGAHYILTAGHVWHAPLSSNQALKEARMLGITVHAENSVGRFLMDPREIVAFGPERSENWNEWGPDLVLLRIPAVRAGAINAQRKVFYNLARRRPEASVDHCELRLLMGTPECLGTFSPTHANLEITGLYMQADPVTQVRCDFDYVDFEVDPSIPGVPRDFGGVSGAEDFGRFMFTNQPPVKLSIRGSSTEWRSTSLPRCPLATESSAVTDHKASSLRPHV